MKLLHTSDWHLGRTLYSKKERHEEHAAFLKWLQTTIVDNSVDLLIVAGDIFDSASPGANAQKMYYDFLLKVRNSKCRNVVIVGGNHDSPSFLNAPKEILSALNVYVIGKACENIEDEIIIIHNKEAQPIAIVCAVPFLRERDISRFTEGETYGERSKRIAENIKKHYEHVAEIAENMRKSINKKIPVIATGHLSVAGGIKTDDDGVRETYIGNIECIGKDIFSQTFDYVALGHYHIPSVIYDTVRYCGSPIHIGFGEANQAKNVYIVDFDDNKANISTVEIPVFQKLASIRGDKAFIYNRLNELIKLKLSVWVEIIYEGDELFPNFTEWVNSLTYNTQIEIIKLQNKKYLSDVLSQNDGAQLLAELDKYDVFDIVLGKNNIPDEQKAELKNLYREIVVEMLIEN